MGRWAYMSSTDSDGDHTNMEYKFWFGCQSSLSVGKYDCGVLTERRMYNGEEFEANESMSKMLADAIEDWINTRDDASDCGRCQDITCDEDMRELMCNDIEWFSEWIINDNNDLDDIFEFNEDLPEILFDYNDDQTMKNLYQAYTYGEIGEIEKKLPHHTLYLINKKKVETWDDIEALWTEACDDWVEFSKVVEPLLETQEEKKAHEKQAEDYSNALLARIIWEQLRLSKAEVNIVFEY